MEHPRRPDEPPIGSDPTRCPLCGRANSCAMAADPAATDCWCFHAEIAPEALAAVPPEVRGLVCICADCAAGASPP